MRIRILAFIFLTISGLQSQAQITREELAGLQNIFQQEYGPIVEINKSPAGMDPDFWWNYPAVHASYSGYIENSSTHHLLYLMGGYGRLPGMTVDGVAATLCHELGHGMGGAPHKKQEGAVQTSVEGQADYFAYASCLPRIFSKLKTNTTIQEFRQCANHVDKKYCNRAFSNLKIEQIYFVHEDPQDVSSIDSKDLSVVSSVNTNPAFSPSAQCRIDTMIAGIFKSPRPACWFSNELPR